MPRKSSKQVKGRERKAFISAMNIVLHPHSPSLYIELLEEIFRSHDSIKVYGQSAIMFGSCRPISGDAPESGLYGVIYKFFQLDPDEPWFNLETREEADKTAKSIIKIPQHLKPHLQEFPFVFYPKGHRFYFVSKRSGQALSTKFMLGFFEKIVQFPRFARFGSIKFTIEPERESINKILNLPRLKILHLDIYQPNPDDQRSAEEKMQRRLKDQNVKRMQNIYTEANQSGIKPDDDTKIFAKIAASNGKVVAKGVDSTGKMVNFSTASHPLAEEITYDSNTQSEALALQEYSDQLHKSIT